MGETYNIQNKFGKKIVSEIVVGSSKQNLCNNYSKKEMNQYNLNNLDTNETYFPSESSMSPRPGSVPLHLPLQLKGISSSAGYAFSCK